MPKNLLVLLHFIYTGDCIHPHKTVFPKRNSKIPYLQPRRIESKVLYFSLQFAVQGTLKSLLQHHSSKASVLLCSIVQLSHSYKTTGKTIALTRRTFVGKVMSPLFNMLSKLVIGFPPRSKSLLISWRQSPSAVILEPPKINLSLFPLFPQLFAMKWWDQMHDLSFLNVEL